MAAVIPRGGSQGCGDQDGRTTLGGRPASCPGVCWRSAGIRATIPTARSFEEPWDTIRRDKHDSCRRAS